MTKSSPARAALVMLLVTACARDDDRTSDVALHEAITRLRKEQEPLGVTSQRRLLLGAVQQLPAPSSAATAAQTACVTAYRELLDAEDDIYFAEVRVKMAGPSPGSLVAVLARAEERLAAAKQAMPECDAASARLAIAAR